MLDLTFYLCFNNTNNTDKDTDYLGKMTAPVLLSHLKGKLNFIIFTYKPLLIFNFLTYRKQKYNNIHCF